MKSILFGFLTAAMAACFSPPSEAAEALWSQGEYWRVEGSTKGWCAATATFVADQMTIGYDKNGQWSLFFASPNTEKMFDGEKKSMRVMFDDGQVFVLSGLAIGTQQLAFTGVTDPVIGRFAMSKQMRIENFNTYNLKGTAAALKSVTECVSAMSALPAPAATAPEPTGNERDA